MLSVIGHLYLILNTRIIKDRINVMMFVMIRGREPIKNPYIAHIKTPAVRRSSINREISFADCVFHVFATWGKKALVVSIPPKSPSRVVESNSVKYLIMFPICKDYTGKSTQRKEVLEDLPFVKLSLKCSELIRQTPGFCQWKKRLP
jgi:hypothetical protein